MFLNYENNIHYEVLIPILKNILYEYNHNDSNIIDNYGISNIENNNNYFKKDIELIVSII